MAIIDRSNEDYWRSPYQH